MSLSTEDFIAHIHRSPTQVVLASSGGGSRAVAELLDVPGASRTVLEAVVPYSEPAMIAWLGGRPDQFCSSRTARAMAMVAFGRARRYAASDASPAGVACTASLASDRPKRGPHRAHVAVQTADRTAEWFLQMAKDRRSRADEEQLVSRLLLCAVADACGIEERLDLPLGEGEQVKHSQTAAPQPWQDLLLGTAEAVCRGDAGRPVAVLSGAFNPLHAGHRRMAEVARQVLGTPVAMEISIVNVDKPPLDYREIACRLGQFPAEQAVWLTRAATFEEKSRLFPGAVFVVGADTLRRIAAPQYYAGDATGSLRVLERIAARGCRFLVFGRDMGTGFVRLGDLELPEVLRQICREVPPERFREDVSSTAIRREEGSG